MFDKLIVSEPEGADFKNRRNYFMVSSLAVGLLFLAAVVASIYASDYGLGHDNFVLVDMVAPPVTATEPAPPRPQAPTTPSRSTSPLPTRQVNMVNMYESPIVPTTISTTKNTQVARPYDGKFLISSTNTNPPGSGRTESPGTGTGLGDPNPGGSGSVAENTVEPPPPTNKNENLKPAVTKPAPQSLGVINGKATNLQKPIYSAAAKAVGAQGTVDVQVSIDEQGNVTSARAVTGHPLLRSAAELAARTSKFSTTYLSHVPVKVTGVIVYNFIK